MQSSSCSGDRFVENVSHERDDSVDDDNNDDNDDDGVDVDGIWI
jgi:hypothetical protein